MATITGYTADRMQAIEDGTVIAGDVDDSGNLILIKHDGTQINAGSVIGPEGPQGPISSDLDVITATAVLDVGIVNQIRAGRQLSAADFTNMGLSVPIGLWNLSDLSDASGNGRNLINKGAVQFDKGINGSYITAAKFSGSTGQALYIADTGANDSFRIKGGSWGCWFKTAKRGVAQQLISKHLAAGSSYGYDISIDASNFIHCNISTSNAAAFSVNVSGVDDVCDNRWHFVAATFNGGVMRLYLDSILEVTRIPTSSGGIINPSSGPINIGGYGGDASTDAISPHFGMIDEAFITSDILTEDQIRNLYCAKISHALGSIPTRASLNVRRRRRGVALAPGDFLVQPLRLYNFSGGALADEGSDNVALSNNNTAVAVTGADGTKDNAFNFNGTNQSLSATDTGLPSGLIPRSYGCWFKTPSIPAGNGGVITWGTISTADDRLVVSATGGTLNGINAGDSITGPFVCDGQWHFAVVVEENAPTDSIKRKLYLDGRLVGSSTVVNSITLAGANKFRIGAYQDGTGLFNGQIDGVFVCNYSLTPEQILSLYAKSSQSLGVSPKNSGDHVEAMTATDLLVTFDTLENCHQVDLAVA